jgi:hypothetical protein
MNIPSFLLILLASLATLALDRRWAILPVLAIAFYVPIESGFEIGNFNLYGLRLVVGVGLLRTIIRGESIGRSASGMDKAVVIWAAVAVLASLFHQDVGATLINRVGAVYTTCGSYYLFRVFCQSPEECERVCCSIAVLMIPLGVLIAMEKSSGINAFSALGGVPEFSEVRNGIIRAQGPFTHSILSGTIGAASVPLALLLFRSHRKLGLAALVACLAIVFSSGSSGPVLSLAITALAVGMWPLRRHMRLIRWSVILSYIGLDIVMNAPAYYLLARMDVTGESTSWHRAALIEAAIDHFSEWWLAGTDYTRHWMAYGVAWSPNHADITNFYIRMGVDGGLMLILAFVYLIYKSFSAIGIGWRQSQNSDGFDLSAFQKWCLGCSLVAHTASFISVSYFDQSIVIFFLLIALISASRRPAMAVEPVAVDRQVKAALPAYEMYRW